MSKQLDDFWKIYEVNAEIFSEIKEYIEIIDSDYYETNEEYFDEIKGYDSVVVHSPAQLKTVIRKHFSTMRKNLAAMQSLSIEIIDTLD